MLYSMARRYDEFPGSMDQGSSLRGALKGWYKHGACVDALWKTGIEMPPAPQDVEDDWWLDAVRRPLGAYYRIDPRAFNDMHAALNEIGIIYASAVWHAGWDAGYTRKQPRARPSSFAASIFTIPPVRAEPRDGGDAFAIVGYSEAGFLLQNFWGDDWGSRGYAILTYADWLANAMDCWVTQLGVVTSEHLAIDEANTLRTDARGTRVSLAGSDVLRDREIAPFVINVGNNGRLSNSGQFRTTEDDVRAIVDIHLAEARKHWGLVGKPVDVCICAHGGLVGEKAAADNAALDRLRVVGVVAGGDNGIPAEHWSENLLHPYPGNTSSLSDCMKLLSSSLAERKAVVIFGFEHTPPVLSLEPALLSFELVALQVLGIPLGPRVEQVRTGLVHPVHQQLRVFGYEVLANRAAAGV